MTNVIAKTSDQREAEAEVESFRRDLGPFVVAAETSRMPMIFADATVDGHPIIFANESFLDLTGYDEREVLGQRFDFLVTRDTEPETLERLAAEFHNASHGNLEICCNRKDGSVFWAGLFISPVSNAGGEVVQHFASFVNLTAHKEEESESRMLIDELNHRVKNTLSTVQSIVYQALKTATDPAIIRESIESRVFALSRSHDLLSRENWKSAGLLDIVKEALEPFGVTDGRAERFVISGNNYRFAPKAVLALSIAFNELATNAVKYGAFSNASGRILISWVVQTAPDGNRLTLRWQEKDGPPVTPPYRKGFGSRVIERGLVHELDGAVDLDYRPDGVVCTISVPLQNGARIG